MRLFGRILSLIGVLLLLVPFLLVPAYAASPSCGSESYWRVSFRATSGLNRPAYYGWYNNGDITMADNGSLIPPSFATRTSQFYISSIPQIGDDPSVIYEYTSLRSVNTISNVMPYVSYKYTIKFTSAVGYPSYFGDSPVVFYGADGTIADVAMVSGYDTSTKTFSVIFYGGDGFKPSYISVEFPVLNTTAPNDLYVTQSISVVEDNDVNMSMVALYEQLGDISLKLDEGLANDDRLYNYLQDVIGGSANLDSSSLDEGSSAIEDLENLEDQIHDAMGTASLDFDQLEDVWADYDVDVMGFANAGVFFSDVLECLLDCFGILPFFALTLGLIMTVLGR